MNLSHAIAFTSFAFVAACSTTNFSKHPDGSYAYQNHRNPWPGNASAHTNYSTTTPVRAVEIAAAEPVVAERPEPVVVAAPVRLEAAQVKIDERIVFEAWRSQIEASSLPILAQLAEFLVDNPHVRRVEIQGHTARMGQERAMMELSQARAEAVRDVLVAHGVDSARLVAKGYGESQPLGAEHSDEDRRVEFHVIDGGQVALR
ncbi:MAG: OmpA family protein [Deltaproteobacteria bacterium]|jgi:outer membrane protein OmpA-like peptidoglycan-associated protein